MALSPNQRAWRRFKHHPLGLTSGIFLALSIGFILAGPAFLGYSADAFSGLPFEPPSPAHWCGTDVHGRDLLARIFYGARISLLVGAVGTLVSLFIGVLWGATAGYLGGRWDSILMRTVDVLYSLPSIIFVIVLITTLETYLKPVLTRFVGTDASSVARLLFLFAGLGAVSWLTMARIVRGQVLSLRSRGFVEASRALGAGNWRIIWRHLLPNVYGLIIVYLTLTVPAVMLSESFLSYLGLGIQPPQASLGSLIADGAGQINPIRIYWWLIVFPGLTLVGMLLALNFLGDALREAWDTRSVA